jgi:hypothetical protein
MVFPPTHQRFFKENRGAIKSCANQQPCAKRSRSLRPVSSIRSGKVGEFTEEVQVHQNTDKLTYKANGQIEWTGKTSAQNLSWISSDWQIQHR